VCRNVEREFCERQEKVTLLLPLPSFLLVIIIGYNKSIVLLQDMIVLMCVLHTTYSSNVDIGIHCYRAYYRGILMHSTTTRLWYKVLDGFE
jgi:hypothetical protein